MRGVLTPHMALAYLRELSPAVAAAAIVDAGGHTLAGELDLGAAPAQPGPRLAVVEHHGARLLAATTADALIALVSADAQAALTAVRERC